MNTTDVLKLTLLHLIHASNDVNLLHDLLLTCK